MKPRCLESVIPLTLRYAARFAPGAGVPIGYPRKIDVFETRRPCAPDQSPARAELA